MFLLKKKRVQEEAFTPFDGVVNTKKSNLLIRAGGSKVLQRISSAPKGARMRVIGKEGQWYKIIYKGTKGFVHEDYILPLDQMLVHNSCQSGENSLTD